MTNVKLYLVQLDATVGAILCVISLATFKPKILLYNHRKRPSDEELLPNPIWRHLITFLQISLLFLSQNTLAQTQAPTCGSKEIFLNLMKDQKLKKRYEMAEKENATSHCKKKRTDGCYERRGTDYSDPISQSANTNPDCDQNENKQNPCTGIGYGQVLRNYMGYPFDHFISQFTNDQRTRMRDVI